MPQFPKVASLFRASLLALCVPLISGCITTEQPLTSAHFNDNAVIGTWKSAPNQEPILMTVSAMPDGGYKVVTSEPNNATGKPHVLQYTAFLSKGATSKYVSVAEHDKPHSFTIMQYAVGDKVLELKNSTKDVAGTPEKVLEMVDGPNGPGLFDKQLVFERMSPTEEIKTVLDKQAEDWNTGNLDAFMTAYEKSPNITYVSSDGEVRGYAALEERYRKKYGNDKASMGKLSFANLRVQNIGPADAFAIGNWQLHRDGKPDLHGIFTLILVHSDGGWKIIHDHTSVLAAAEKKK